MRVGDDHVFSLEVLYTPYAPARRLGRSNEPERWLERFATLVRARLPRRRAPLAGDDAGPLRVATSTSPAGHATSFAGGPLAALLGRQPELTRYETPIGGLYLTGAATFPGAGVWGASGRNAAAVVLRHAQLIAIRHHIG